MDKRLKVREGLHELYLPYFDQLCKKLGPEWQPYCGLRSPAEQQLALNAGTSKAGPWESPHNYGCATDWCLWLDGKPLWPEKDDPRWLPYVQACWAVGLQAGAYFTTLTDYPHNEYKLFLSWKKVKTVYDTHGLDAAMLFIKQVHVS